MKTYTIELPDDVAHVIEVRAAIDDLKAEAGLQQLICKVVEIWGATYQSKEA
jgi:hypothetical protein